MPKRTNGEGTIYQRKDGLWIGEITTGYEMLNGKLKRNKEMFSSKDLEVVQNKMNEAKLKLSRNLYIQKSDYTVAEWVLFWLENYKTNSIKAKTYDCYEYALNSHIKDSIGNIKIAKIRPEMIQKLYNEMGKRDLSTSTIQKVHITLNQAFKQALNNELIYKNPCDATIVPKTKKRKAVALSVDEQKRFTEHCPNTTYGRFFMFALNTGMRCGEIISLTWGDIDFTEKTINVRTTASTVKNRDEDAETKTKIIIDTAKTNSSMRSIPINKIAYQILSTQKSKPKNEVFVFSSKVGTILQERNVNRAFSDVSVTAELPDSVTLHTLRHTFASRLIAKNINPKVLSELLGHSSIQVTYDTYGHLFMDQKKEAINLLD